MVLSDERSFLFMASNDQLTTLDALPPRSTTQVTLDKLPDSKEKPNRVRDAYCGSTPATRPAELQKCAYRRVSILRPHNMQDPSYDRHSKDTIHH